jgi:hypothetical protein
LLDDELMSDTRMARRPFSWSSIAAIVVEAAAACGFVIAVYELVVAGGSALLSPVNGTWKLVLWTAAAAISGAGLTAVRSRARRLVRRLLRPADPYQTLMSSVSGATAAGPVEDALPRLARMLADGTGARGAAVWLAGPSGWWRAGSWPEDEGADQPGTVVDETVADEAALRALAGVDHVALVRDGGQVLGALTLRAREGRDLALPDVRLATDMANAAGLLLRNAELTERLREQVRVETAQAAELAASRRRVVVARDAAREQLSAEIQARVCAPLALCAGQVSALGLGEPPAEEPGSAAAEDPAAGTAEKPAAGTAEKPAAGTAEEPAAGTAEEPAAGTAEEPAAGTAEEPAAGTAEEPAAGTAEEPAAGTAEEPAAGTAEDPVAGTAEDPVTGTAEDPAAGAALAAGLAVMTSEIDAAIADFRRIVHGVYPPVLTDHGLRAAMENLLTDVDPQGALVSHRIPRLAARIEAGTYFCAAALLREWNGSGADRPMRVLVGVTSTRIQMTFVDGVARYGERSAMPVSPLVYESVLDRVAAMGGRMEVDGDESGRWLAIEVPLVPADLTAQEPP